MAEAQPETQPRGMEAERTQVQRPGEELQVGAFQRLKRRIFGHRAPDPENDMKGRGFYLWVLVIIGALGLALCALLTREAEAFAVAGLASMAVFFFGALLGFLFGVPRRESEPTEEATGTPRATIERSLAYRANTNLEQISDWLTKILVGVGLTQFRSIASGIDGLADDLAAGLTGGGDAPSAGTTQGALALLVFYFVDGFLFFYLWTRLYLPELFQVAERRAERVLTTRADKLERLRARSVADRASGEQAERNQGATPTT